MKTLLLLFFIIPFTNGIEFADRVYGISDIKKTIDVSKYESPIEIVNLLNSEHGVLVINSNSKASYVLDNKEFNLFPTDVIGEDITNKWKYTKPTEDRPLTISYGFTVNGKLIFNKFSHLRNVVVQNPGKVFIKIETYEKTKISDYYGTINIGFCYSTTLNSAPSKHVNTNPNRK